MRLIVFVMILLASPISIDNEVSDILSEDQFIYSNAKKLHIKTGRPLIVVLGATWCGPCVSYKKTTLQQLAQDIKDGKSEYLLAIVDVDKSPNLVIPIFGFDNDNKAEKNSSIPFTAIYSFENGVCKKRQFYGQKNREDLDDILKQVDEKRDPIAVEPTNI